MSMRFSPKICTIFRLNFWYKSQLLLKQQFLYKAKASMRKPFLHMDAFFSMDLSVD